MKTRIAQIIKVLGIMAIVAAFAAAAFPTPSFANSADDYGKVAITVTNSSSPLAGIMPVPVAGAVIEVTGSNGVAVAKAITDDTGNVSIALPQGAYKIKVSAPGFASSGASFFLKAGTTEYVKIGLQSASRTR